MPRSQRTNLVKTAVNETSLGEFKSKVGGAVAMPFVQPQKSAGQALAEGVGMVAKAAATVGQVKVDESNKRIAIEQRNKGMMRGREAANGYISESRELLKTGEITLEKVDGKQSVNEWFAIKMGAFNDELGQTDNVNTSYLSGAFQSIGNSLASEQATNDKLVAERALEAQVTTTRGAMLEQFQAGIDGATIYDELQTTGALNLTNAEYGKMYISTMEAYIERQHLDTPGYDAQADIDKYMKITTKKGAIDFATHPTYGATIRKLESRIATTNKARVNAADDATKEKFTNWTNQSLLTLSGKPTFEELNQINMQLEGYQDAGVASSKYAMVVNGLSTHLDRTGFGKASNPEVFNVFKQQALEGELNQELFQFNKNQITRGDFTDILGMQAKYARDASDDTQKTYVAHAKLARNAGLSLIVEGAEGGIFRGTSSAKTMGFAYNSQYTEWVEGYKAENEGQWPAGTVANAKALEIATGIINREKAFKVGESAKTTAALDATASPEELAKTKADRTQTKEEESKTYKQKPVKVSDLEPSTWQPGAEKVENFEYLRPFFDNNDGAGIMKLIEGGIITKENAQKMKKHFK